MLLELNKKLGIIAAMVPGVGLNYESLPVVL